jgi:hypothetical protein
LGKKFITDEEVSRAEKHAELQENNTSWWSESLPTAFEQESVASWLLRDGGNEDFIPDLNWSPSDEDINSWNEGVEDRFHDALGESVSAKHATAIKARVLETQERDKIINSHGVVAGVTARVLGGIFDPAAIAVTVASEGLFALPILAGKVGRIGNAVRGGLAAATGNVALDAYLVHERPDMKASDLIYSVAGGAIFGGGIGALKRVHTPESKWIIDSLQDIQNNRVLDDLKGASLPLTEKGVRQLGNNKKYWEEIALASGESLTRGQRKRIDGKIKNLTHDLTQQLKKIKAYKKANPLIAKAGRQLSGKKSHQQLSKAEEQLQRELTSIKGALEELKATRSADVDVRSFSGNADAKKIVLEARMNHIPPEGALRMLRGETLEQVMPKAIPKAKVSTLSEPKVGISSPKALKDRALASDEGIRSPSTPNESVHVREDANGEDVELDSPHSNVHITRMEEDMPEEVGKSYGSSFRLDRSSWAGSSPIALARYVNGIIFEDAPGYTNTNLIKAGSASIFKKIMLGRIMYHHNKSFQMNFKGWLEEKGKTGRFQNFRGDSRSEFNEEVAKAVRGTQSPSQFVNAHASHQADAYEQMLQAAQKYGVTGVENLEKNRNYIPRIWSAVRLRSHIDEVGREVVVANIARSLRPKTKNFPSKEGLVGDDPTPEDLERTANGIINIVLNAQGGGVDIHKVISTTDIPRLKSHLKDFQVPEADIETFIASLKHGKQSADSNVSRLQRRIEMDETTEVSMYFDNNAEGLFHNYANSMTGHIALARQGIRNEQDMEEILSRIRTRQSGEQADGTMGDAGSVKNKEVIGNLRDGYNHLIGRPLEADPNSFESHSARIVRKLNFARLMNQVGLAQIPEVGVAVGQLGFRVMLQHIPEMGKIFKRMDDGKFVDDLAEELDDWMGGYSSMSLLNPPTNQVDEVGSTMRKGGGFRDKVNAGEKKLDQLNYAVGHSSGFFGINQVIKNMTMKGMAQKWVNSIDFDEIGHKGKKLTSADRMHDLGISEEMQELIKGQIKQHSKLKEGSTKLKNLNLEEWDEGVRDTFVMSMRRWGDGIIQDNDMGSSHRWLDSSITGKVILQFRSFVLQAWSRHLVKGAKYKDFAFVQEMAFSMMTAAMVYEVQQRLTTLGRDDRDELLEDRLSNSARASNAFSRSAFASIVPAIAESLASPFIEDPIFHRTSGQGTGAFSLDATPSLDLLHDAWNVYGSSAALFDDEIDYTKGDARHLLGVLPFGNHILMKSFWETMFIDGLPEQH